jgi:uncharacterized protein YeaO (DUF488 family)
MSIQVKRAYDEPARSDGYRVLVDRLWPRGVSKDDLKADQWLKGVAPTASLRKWFGHRADKWSEFKKRYFRELASHRDELDGLRQRADKGRVTLVYGAKDQAHNNAIALKEYLERR